MLDAGLRLREPPQKVTGGMEPEFFDHEYKFTPQETAALLAGL